MKERGATGGLPRFSLERRISVLVLFLTALVVGSRIGAGMAALWALRALA